MAPKKTKTDKPFEVGEIVCWYPRTKGYYSGGRGKTWGKIARISDAGVISVHVVRGDKTETVLHRPSRYGRPYSIDRPSAHELAERGWRKAKPDPTEVTLTTERWGGDNTFNIRFDLDVKFGTENGDPVARVRAASAELAAIAEWLDKHPVDSADAADAEDA